MARLSIVSNCPWLAALGATFVFIVAPCLGCSPPMGPGANLPPTLEYKMMDSDVVAYGVPIKTEPDTRFPGDSVYVVDFQVRCIFKGAPLREVIRIYEVGVIPGKCLATNMTVGETMLVYLERIGDKLQPSYVQDPGDSQYLDEVVVLCEATVSYPIGYGPDNNKETCPEEYEYDDCVPIPTPTTVLPPPEPSPEPELPKDDKTPPPPPEDKSKAGEMPADTPDTEEAPYKPVSSNDEDSNPTDPENSAATFTLHLGALLCLFLSAMIL
ncbi:uncharacterized protein LOC106011166 [Aplysia californica]|uniref:Uncharacterized protein LOC106011166 n=1 Tax=Aplysia californica TaxID=6500 RepID=A0ABM0ZVD4_APLCA|nr:uncharacterized protein LOC106011166 [Aplysia californica]